MRVAWTRDAPEYSPALRICTGGRGGAQAVHCTASAPFRDARRTAAQDPATPALAMSAPPLSPSIVPALDALLAGMAAAAAGGPPARLLAVSKTQPADAVARVAAALRARPPAGPLAFGENYVQEALEKQPALAGLGIEWHLIGHLQSNKAKKAGELFHVVHSVDGAEQLVALDKGAMQAGHTVEALVQVDLAGEATKHGIEPDAVFSLFEAAARCQAVRPVGLMLLPPAAANPEAVRPYFKALQRLRADLRSRGVPDAALRELSMGMSHDFEVAVEEGATMVRVGSAIFGPRTYA